MLALLPGRVRLQYYQRTLETVAAVKRRGTHAQRRQPPGGRGSSSLSIHAAGRKSACGAHILARLAGLVVLGGDRRYLGLGLSRVCIGTHQFFLAGGGRRIGQCFRRWRGERSCGANLRSSKYEQIDCGAHSRHTRGRVPALRNTLCVSMLYPRLELRAKRIGSFWPVLRDRSDIMRRERHKFVKASTPQPCVIKRPLVNLAAFRTLKRPALG